MQTPPNVPVRKKSKSKYIILIVIAALVVIVGARFIPHSNDSDNGNNDTQYLEIAARANADKVASKDLYAAYENNEISADQTYKNKMLRVSGIITAIGTDVMGEPYVELDNGVQCVMENKDGLASLTKSQFITISGVCKGRTINVILEKGKIFY